MPLRPDCDIHQTRNADGSCTECMKDARRRSYDKHGRTLPARFSSAQAAARRRSIPWALSFEQWSAVVARPCVYAVQKESDIVNGVDRADNDLGYAPENSVSCCARHNEIKSDVFTRTQMLDLVKRYSVRCANTRAGRTKGERREALSKPRLLSIIRTMPG